MNTSDLTALLPLLLLAATPVAVMLAIAARRSHAVTLGLTLAGLLATLASLVPVSALAPRHVTPLLMVDLYALFYIGMIVAAAFLVAVLAYQYLARCGGLAEEWYVLLLVATLGAAVLVASTHFVSFFLGLEILSVSLYALIAYLPRHGLSVEAAIKYLVLAAASAAFLLFGMALLYAEFGTMEFGRMAESLAARAGLSQTLVLCGVTLIVTGIGFKLGVVPFHLWTPDVYQGAPAPVTAFVATVSKGAVFGLLLRYFTRSAAHSYSSIFLVFSIIAVASMVAGNLLALLQENVKRILAYSSIAHLGYLLVAFQAGGPYGPAAATFYLVAYFVTTLGAFGLITVLSPGQEEMEDIADYRGLFWRRPVLAGIFTAMLFSLAGIPLTAGFLGKFYLVAAGASSGTWALLVTLVATSAIGLYYYLRIVVALYSRPEQALTLLPRVPASGGAVLAFLTVLLFCLGVYPAPLLELVRTAVAGLG